MRKLINRYFSSFFVLLLTIGSIHFSSAAVIQVVNTNDVIQVVKTNEGGANISSKGDIGLFTSKKKGFKTFSGAAKFDFHPEQLVKINDASLNIDNDKLSINKINATYNKNEKHETSGKVEFALSTEKKKKKDRNGKEKEGIEIKAEVTAEISPGKSTNKPVSILAKLTDPLSFSDIDENANFGYLAEGVQIDPFLNAGFGFEFTSLPSDLDTFDPSLLPHSKANMRSFLLPESITSAEIFSERITGVLPLYDIEVLFSFDPLTSLPTVSIDLTFNSPDDSKFSFDVFNSLGEIFDWQDAAQLFSLEEQIKNSFSLEGNFLGLTNTLPLFFIEVTPLSSVEEFSVGLQSEVELSGTEVGSSVSAPATFLLFSLLFLAFHKKVKTKEEN